MEKTQQEYHNCLYAAHGCSEPTSCATCGFDKSEAQRRKRIPFTRDSEGR